MKKYTLLPNLALLLVLLAAWPLAAQTNYQADLIPKNLRAYANAVVRTHETTVEVKDLDEVYLKVKEIITILNNSGEEYGYITVYYDKSRQIKSLKASVLDAEGNFIRKVSTHDFQDVSAISNFSLFEDDRLKYFKPQVATFPYTVVYEYELKLKQTLHLPEWHPQAAPDIAVESSQFTFLAKPAFQTRLRELNIPLPHQESTTKDFQKYSWSAQNLAARKAEPYSPPADSYLPSVEIAPVDFKYEGLKGRMTNWQEYGQWSYQNLLQGRDALPPATVARVNELIKNCATPREKVQKLYEYSQQKNRYISVQIGIGGLQPMRAEEVDRLGYGDCKALTNYTKSLLQAAGISSIYTEVHAGSYKRSYTPEFASLQGNHVILCVPLTPQDTVWLECTSKEAPAGYLGDFTDDRNVLLCTEKGGILTRTPRYDARQNRQIRQANLTLDAQGNLRGHLETRFEGTQYDNRDRLLQKSTKEKQDEVRKIYPLPNLNIVRYDLTQQKTSSPATIEKLELEAGQAGTLNGNLLVVALNQFNHDLRLPKEVRRRQNKVYINRGFFDEDIITYQLPAGFKTETLPAPVDLQTPFGRYLAKAEIKANQIIYTRQLTLNQGEHAPEAYDQFFTFLQKVTDNDQAKLVLAKQ